MMFVLAFVANLLMVSVRPHAVMSGQVRPTRQ
jgi:hypothetical protein